VDRPQRVAQADGEGAHVLCVGALGAKVRLRHVVQVHDVVEDEEVVDHATLSPRSMCTI